jgi:hypothetical protein
VRIEYRRNGRRVSLNALTRGLRDDALDALAKEIESKARRVRCPVHGTTPTRVWNSGSGASRELRASGCCDALIAAVRQQVRTR